MGAVLLHAQVSAEPKIYAYPAFRQLLARQASAAFDDSSAVTLLRHAPTTRRAPGYQQMIVAIPRSPNKATRPQTRSPSPRQPIPACRGEKGLPQAAAPFDAE